MGEPFSLVRLVDETLTFVRSVAQGLSAATQRIRQDAGKALDGLEIEVQMKIDVAHFERWQELWCAVQNTAFEDYYQTLWGRDGYDEIKRLLNCIRDDCRLVAKCVKALGENTTLTRRRQSNHSQKWWRLIARLNFSSDHSKREPDGEDLYEASDRLSNRIEKLLNISERHFRSLHGIAPTKNEDCRFEASQRVLQCAAFDRLEAIDIFTFCQSWQSDFSLDLNMLNHDQEIDVFPDLSYWSDLTPSYHLLLHDSKAGPGPINVIIEPCEPRVEAIDCAEPSGLTQLTDFVTTLCDANFGLNVRVPSTTVPHKDLYLHVTSYQRKVELVERNDKLDTVPYALLGLGTPQDKISFAYSLVESSLFLLASPWLEQLNDGNLEYWDQAASGGLYALRIKALSEIDKTKLSSANFEQEQIRRIGVVLVQIAVGQAICTPEATALETARKALPDVEVRMDCRYTQACRFCVELSDSSSAWNELSTEPPESEDCTAPTDLFRSYYHEVFTRLRDIHGTP